MPQNSAGAWLLPGRIKKSLRLAAVLIPMDGPGGALEGRSGFKAKKEKSCPVSVQPFVVLSNMNYVDGFLLAVPKKKITAYRSMAAKACKIWLEHGALDYRECVGDDLNVKMGTPFPKGIKTKPNETVVFAYIVYKSRAHRDRVNAKVMKDPRIQAICDPKDTPFDPDRMMYGGFKTIVGT
jgi:uncharacterized protein YbaA (DUF1428 family)